MSFTLRAAEVVLGKQQKGIRGHGAVEVQDRLWHGQNILSLVPLAIVATFLFRAYHGKRWRTWFDAIMAQGIQKKRCPNQCSHAIWL